MPTSSQPDPSSPLSDEAPAPLRDYEVVVCVSGGIAAYKTATLVSRLVQRGAGVTVALTRNARRFVGPLTFRALTGRPVLSSMWKTEGDADIRHLGLSERADLIVVAPATANLIGKLANGIADDLISTLLIGAACPVLMAPAMNNRMWAHPAVRRNVAVLSEIGVTLVGPEEGWLACRSTGPGRMSEPETILAAVEARLRAGPSRTSAT